MGNIVDIGTCSGKDEEHLTTILSPLEKDLVKASLEFLKEELPNLGVVVFIRFFETQPKFKVLFPTIVRINDKNELELDMNEDTLLKHAHNVMHSLGAVIESMEDPENINTLLNAVGHIHVRRYVKPKMLRRLWPSIDFGLKEFLRGRYTKEISVGWKKVFFYTCRQLEKGMKSAKRKEREKKTCV